MLFRSMEYVLKEYASRDSRILWKKLEKNQGIAGNTNEAIAMAGGEFVGLLDHDDLLAPNALYEIASALEQEPDIDVLYTDEDKVRGDGLEHFQPHFKPDFSPDLLRSNNYICHFFVARRILIEKVGGFSSAFDGAQDHDFIFRCTEQAGKIHHIPEILYHWRTHQSSTADNPETQITMCGKGSFRWILTGNGSNNHSGTMPVANIILYNNHRAISFLFGTDTLIQVCIIQIAPPICSSLLATRAVE